jgi:predicted cobalt transporter CbtA
MQAVAMAPAIGGVVWSALTVLACEWSLTGRTTWRTVPRLLTPLLPLLPVAALSAGRPWYVNLAIVALALSLFLLHTGRSDAESFGTATSLLKQLFISPVRFMFGAPTPRLRGGR